LAAPDRQKGSKAGKVALPPLAWGALNRYLAQRRLPTRPCPGTRHAAAGLAGSGQRRRHHGGSPVERDQALLRHRGRGDWREQPEHGGQAAASQSAGCGTPTRAIRSRAAQSSRACAPTCATRPCRQLRLHERSDAGRMRDSATGGWQIPWQLRRLHDRARWPRFTSVLFRVGFTLSRKL